MKKCGLLFMLLFLLIFAGCIKQELKNENEAYDIKIKSPIVFSHNSVEIADGRMVFVNIEMKSGQYVFDEFAGAFQGSNWNGQYQIRVYTDEDNFKNPDYLETISIFDNQPMNFKNEFKLIFDDYNNDGNPDFTLGQYASSNGFEYALFTINHEGKVETLDTGGLMFISEHDYSIKLEKLSPISFKKSCYDNSIGETIERVYQWNDDRFISTTLDFPS